jgi:hypothetical protein
MNKQIFLFAFAMLLCGAAYSQNNYCISFEGTGLHENETDHLLWIDTLANPDNTWQIGAPQKPVFTSASTQPNAIVTDTLDSYPVNDVSSFLLRHNVGLGFLMPNWVVLAGRYAVDSDTLTDFGTIEFSPDNGGLWIDLVNDTSYGSAIDWGTFNTPPALTGSSGGWREFAVHLEQLGPLFQMTEYDTVLFRFTFTSDGVQTNRDGLMFDSLSVWDVPPVGIQEHVGTQLQVQVFPNPSAEQVTLAWGSPLQTAHLLLVYDNTGRCVATRNVPAGEAAVTFLTTAHPPGAYVCRLVSSEGAVTATGTFTRDR